MKPALPVGRYRAVWNGDSGHTPLNPALFRVRLVDAHHDDPQFGHRLLADEADGAGLRACDRRPPLLHGVGRRLRRMRRRFRGHPHWPAGLHHGGSGAGPDPGQ